MATEPRPLLVIDTNIWLDLLAFRDPSVERLRAALHRFDCIASPTMRSELQAVLGRSRFGLDAGQQNGALAAFDAIARSVAEAPDCRLACSDPDDRVFLDVAVGLGARWLLSRDKALLKARRHALRRHGLLIGRPADFYNWLDQPQTPRVQTQTQTQGQDQDQGHDQARAPGTGAGTTG